MNNKQIMGTAFEYAQINMLSAQISNSLTQLIDLMSMYKRPTNELKQMSDLKLLLSEYHFTYTFSGLEKFIELQK